MFSYTLAKYRSLHLNQINDHEGMLTGFKKKLFVKVKLISRQEYCAQMAKNKKLVITKSAFI